jgi:hypothetical protein
MNDSILLSLATLLIGWLLGRLSSSVEKNYERRASRNRLIFHLIEIFEDITKRKLLDDVVLSYAGSKHKLQALRQQARTMAPDESDRSIDHLHAMIRDTASYDPILAQEVSSTLMPAKALDQRLLTANLDDDEFQILLLMLTKLDAAMLKHLQLVSEELAAKNGLLQKWKIRRFFVHRRTVLKESLDMQRKLREAFKMIAAGANQTREPTQTKS